MKKNQILVGTLAVGMLAITACSSEDPAFNSGTGRISIKSVEIDGSIASSQQSRASYTGSVTADDLKFKLTNKGGQREELTFNSLDEFNSYGDFKVGSYTLEAYHGDLAEEGYDKPYFYDVAEVTVTENNTSEVSINAGIANSLIDVAYTDAFKKYFSSYSVDLYSVNQQKIAYTDYTQPVYVAPGEVNFYLTVKKPNKDTEITLNPLSITAKAKTLHHVTFDVAGGAEDAVLTITFDSNVNDVETVEIELNSDLFNTSGPVVTLSGFESGDVIDLVEGVPVSTGTLKMTVMARAGIGKVNMSTTAPSLTSLGWPGGSDFDLLTATPAQQSAMTALGFDCRGLWKNPDQMAMIDLTNVIPNIKHSNTVEENVFTFTVVDKYTRVCEPIVLKVKINLLELSLSNASNDAGSNKITAQLAYNGPDIKSNVRVQCINTLGNWVDCEYEATEVNSRAATRNYDLTITVPSVMATYRLRAVVGTTASTSTYSPEVSVVPEAPPVYSIASVNSFAKYAYVELAADKKLDMVRNQASFYVSTDGSTFSKVSESNLDRSSNPVKISGLTPGTNYTVKASIWDSSTNACEGFTFATEGATQLPNCNLEDWTQEQPTTQYQIIYYPTGWDTMNELTTSTRGTGTSVFSYGGTAYRAHSGTQPTSDSHSGTAAYIATVGWGSGNTAAGNSGKCENLTVGQLYLGHYDASAKAAVYDGIAFTSRPSSMSFYYKYTPKNTADYGYAEVIILDADGVEMVKKSQNLTAQSSYQLVTFPFVFTGTKKPAKIKVVFKSSNNPDCQTINTTNLSYPAFANTSDGRYTGSELYIDAITLNY